MRAMKDSEIEWIGEIPVGWDIGKIKYLINFNPRYQGDIDDGELASFIPMECLTNGHISPKKKPIGEVKKAYTFFAENDIIMAKVTPCFENGNIAVARCLLNGIGFGTSEIFVFRCVEIETQYFFYFLQNDIFRQFCIGSMYGTGGLKRVSPDFIRDYKFAIPSLPEQTRIASFLDTKCAAIDAAIENQRATIAKLKEYRQAVITEAVTKGLHPDVPMKDSGIEWIGEIPEGWEVKRIKHLGSIRYGLGEPPEYTDSGLPFIRATDINKGKIDLELVRRVNPDDIPWSRNPELKLHEILVVRSGAYTGDSAIVASDVVGCIAGYDMVLSIGAADPKFVAWVLLSKYMLQGQIYMERLRAAQPHLNAEELGGFIVLTPPFPEQHAIAAYLDQKCTAIDSAVSKKETLIDKLTEYKKSLIYEAVTGKIEVPECTV